METVLLLAFVVEALFVVVLIVEVRRHRRVSTSLSAAAAVLADSGKRVRIVSDKLEDAVQATLDVRGRSSCPENVLDPLPRTEACERVVLGDDVVYLLLLK